MDIVEVAAREIVRNISAQTSFIVDCKGESGRWTIEPRNNMLRSEWSIEVSPDQVTIIVHGMVSIARAPMGLGDRKATIQLADPDLFDKVVGYCTGRIRVQ